MQVRRLQEDDLTWLAGMVSALARHHADVSATDKVAIRRDCLGPAPWLPTWAAKAGQEVVGYAACLRQA